MLIQKFMLNNKIFRLILTTLLISFISCTSNVFNTVNIKRIETQLQKIYIYVGEEKKIPIFIVDKNLNKSILENGFIVTSSNKDILSIDNIGNIKALSVGSSKITIKYLDFFESVDVIVQRKKDIKEIKIELYELTLKKGFVKNLKASVIFEDYSISNDIKWSSSDKNILVIDDFGKVSAINIGKARIYASYILDETYKTYIDVIVE